MDRRRDPRHSTTGVAVLAACGAVLLTSCGGDGGSTSAPGESPSSAATGGGEGRTVTVRETEWAISLSRTEFTPGQYTFRVENAGSAVHALEIDGPGVPGVASETLSAGSTADMNVTLQKGRYELICPIGGHRDLGMETTITVR